MVSITNKKNNNEGNLMKESSAWKMINFISNERKSITKYLIY